MKISNWRFNPEFPDFSFNILLHTREWRDNVEAMITYPQLHPTPTRFVRPSPDEPSSMTHMIGWNKALELSNAYMTLHSVPDTPRQALVTVFKQHNNVTTGSDSVIYREPAPLFIQTCKPPHVYNHQAWFILSIQDQKHVCFHTSIQHRCYVIKPRQTSN